MCILITSNFSSCLTLSCKIGISIIFSSYCLFNSSYDFILFDKAWLTSFELFKDSDNFSLSFLPFYHM